MIFNGVAAGPVRESPVSRKNRLQTGAKLSSDRVESLRIRARFPAVPQIFSVSFPEHLLDYLGGLHHLLGVGSADTFFGSSK
jgi:hypothetical protein